MKGLWYQSEPFAGNLPAPGNPALLDLSDWPMRQPRRRRILPDPEAYDGFHPATFVGPVDTPATYEHGDYYQGPRRRRRAIPAEEDLQIPPTLFGVVLPPGLSQYEPLEIAPPRRRRLRLGHDQPSQDAFDPAGFRAYLHAESDDALPVRRRRPRLKRDVMLDESEWWGPTGADSLRVWFSGAASDGAAQSSQASALGNFRSATEASRCGIIVHRPIAGLTVEFASRDNGLGTGSLAVVSDNEVRYTAPASTTPGPIVYVPNGQTRQVADGANPSKWVRVTRSSSAPLSGWATVEFDEQYNNIFAMSDAAEAESSGGGNRYRAAFLRTDSLATATDLRLYLATLAPSTVSTGGGLPAAGAGTITGPTDGFCSWPQRGWARVEQSAGTLREIVYYSSRTDSALTVPALGRGQLGTAAAAGLATDRVNSVPGIRIGWELANPPYKGAVQTIVSESTAPAGITWSTAIAASAAIAAGDLSTFRQGAIWIHRALPAGVSALARILHLILVRFSVEGRSYTTTLAGLFRIADNDLRRLELHIGVNAEPNLAAAPNETKAVPLGQSPKDYLTANPWTTLATLSAGAVNRVIVNFRNEYDLVSQFMDSTVFRLDGGGVKVNPIPTSPEGVTIAADAGGTFRVHALYYYDADQTNQADQWLIYFRSDGTDPNPGVDAPVVQTMDKADGAAWLDYQTAGFAAGTTGKVIVRVRRSSDAVDSTNTDVHSATAATAGPAAPSGGIHYRGIAEQK